MTELNFEDFPIGTFVFDADAPWDDLRSGMITRDDNNAPGVWFAANKPENPQQPPTVYPLDAFAGRLRIHALTEGFKGTVPRLNEFRGVSAEAIRQLQKAKGRTLAVDAMQTMLRAQPGISHELIDDTLRMMSTMGITTVKLVGKKPYLLFSNGLDASFKRREYLATFTNELLAKSRRIDLLLGHPGTIGSYREELLRTLLNQLLPRQYEATTGFIEGCPRQIDIIVWDAGAYSPLFREQGFVVVPLAAVRAVIEVKTTLTSGTLKQAMDILWDVFRNRMTSTPIFKGIFAYETNLKDANAVARVMRAFYQSEGPHGIRHEHQYYWEGVGAVCVPNHFLVRERYLAGDGCAFPTPYLTAVDSDWNDDVYSALFLGILLSYLDLPLTAKVEAGELFHPALRAMENRNLGEIYPTWRPTLATQDLGGTFNPRGASQYVKNVHAFRAGKISGSQVSEGLAESDSSSLDPVTGLENNQLGGCSDPPAEAPADR
jgi:hypothetical protein